MTMQMLFLVAKVVLSVHLENMAIHLLRNRIELMEVLSVVVQTVQEDMHKNLRVLQRVLLALWALTPQRMGVQHVRNVPADILQSQTLQRNALNAHQGGRNLMKDLGNVPNVS